MAANRAQRRRDQRLRVSRGENVVVASLGQRVRVDDVSMVKLADKRGSEHRWVTTVGFSTPQPSAPGPKLMDQNNMLYVGTGCWDCEQVWSPELEAQPCPAPADDGPEGRD